MDLKQLLAKYLDYIEKKFQSPETLRAYKSDLVHFFYGASSISRPMVMKKVLTLSQYAPATRSRKVAAIKGFLHWAHEKEGISEDFGEALGSIQVPRRLPHFLSVDEATLLW